MSSNPKDNKIRNIGLCEIRLPPEPSKHELFNAYRATRKENASLHEVNAELLEALRNLKGQAGALLAFEAEIRHHAGHTNVQCLIDALEQARAAIARAEEEK